MPTPERVTLRNGRWFVWVALPSDGVVWNHRGVRGACEPRALKLVIV